MKPDLENQGLRIGSIVIDCNEFETVSMFWAKALNYVPREPGTKGWIVLKDPNGRGPNVSINMVDEPITTRNHIHMDLYTDDQKGVVDRLIKCGAKIHRMPESEDEDFIVLSDPEGNLFSLSTKRVSPILRSSN